MTQLGTAGRLPTMADGAPVVIIAGIVAIVIRIVPIIAVIAIGIIIPGTVIPGAVITVPGVPVPVVIPGIIVPGIVSPGAVTPGIVTPGAIIPGTVHVIITEIPGTVGKGIIPCPGWRILYGNDGIVLVKTDARACGDTQGVASAQDISFGRPAVCKKIVKLVLGNRRHLFRHRADIDTVIVGLGLKPAHGCAGQSGKGT